MDIGNVYCEGVHKSFTLYYGNWFPINPIKLGDIGTLNGDMFIYEKNISDLGFKKLNIEKKIKVGNTQFTSEGSVSVKHLAKCEVTELTTSAGLEITFSKENSLFINASNCTVERYSNKTELGNFILKCYNKHKTWNKDWVIVTELIRSDNTNVVISANANSSILLEATSNIETIDIADAQINFSVVKYNGLSYKLISQKNITPFFCLSKIHTTIFKDPKFGACLKDLKGIHKFMSNIDLVKTNLSNLRKIDNHIKKIAPPRLSKSSKSSLVLKKYDISNKNYRANQSIISPENAKNISLLQNIVRNNKNNTLENGALLTIMANRSNFSRSKYCNSNKRIRSFKVLTLENVQ